MNKIIGTPTTTPMKIPDWNQDNPIKADYIKNKPKKEIDSLTSFLYYDDAKIKASEISLFNFALDEETMTATVSAANVDILGNIVIPYEYVVDEKKYSVTKIGDSAFNGCTSLNSINIPDSIINIDGSAFLLCDNLSKVNYEGTKEQWDDIAIGDLNDKLLNAKISYEQILITKGYVDEQLATKAETTDVNIHKADCENPHEVTKEQVGLKNVDNTSDMDKPVSKAVQIRINELTPVSKVASNDTKSILLPNLKGGTKIKSFCIGRTSSDGSTNDSNKIPIILKSKALGTPNNIDNWIVGKDMGAEKNKFAYYDITNIAKKKEETLEGDADTKYTGRKIWFCYDFFDKKATSLRLYALKKNTNPFEVIALTGFFTSGSTDITSYSKSLLLDFSLLENKDEYSEIFSDDYIIALVCRNGTFATSKDLFNMWISRFKYIQFEEGEMPSGYNLGAGSQTKTGTVTVGGVKSYYTKISDEELDALYLENSGTAELIIDTSEKFIAPSDIYVEYYEDINLKYQKMEFDLQNKIAETTELTLES